MGLRNYCGLIFWLQTDSKAMISQVQEIREIIHEIYGEGVLLIDMIYIYIFTPISFMSFAPIISDFTNTMPKILMNRSIWKKVSKKGEFQSFWSGLQDQILVRAHIRPQTKCSYILSTKSLATSLQVTNLKIRSSSYEGLR